MLSFAPLKTRAGDSFAAELSQTIQLILGHAGNPQIAALLTGEDQVFNGQAFPPPARLAAPGWANVREILSEDAHASGAPQAAEYAVAGSHVLLQPAAASAAPAGAAPGRWALSV